MLQTSIGIEYNRKHPSLFLILRINIANENNHNF